MYLHPLLSAHVPDLERKALVKHIELRYFRRNEIVVEATALTPYVYCVGSGLVRAAIAGASENEQVTTDFFRQDELFLGGSLQADSYQAGVTLIAALPSSVYLIPAVHLHSLCLRYPAIAVQLVELEVWRTQLVRQQLRKVSSFPSDALVRRAMHDLTQLAPSDGGGYDKRITQSVIASFTGLSREQVNRIVRDMENRGLITKGKEGVEVPPGFASTSFQPSDFGYLDTGADTGGSNAGEAGGPVQGAAPRRRDAAREED